MLRSLAGAGAALGGGFGAVCAAGGGSVSGPRVPHAVRAVSSGMRSKRARRMIVRSEKLGNVSTMNESEFGALADAALARLDHALEACDLDLDVQWSGSGMLEIEFSDGAQIVVNRHSAAQEIWVAARSGGFHFRWDGAHWRDTRDGRELFAALAALISQQSGHSVRLD